MYIISTAQHARPKVSGQIEPFLPQFRRSSKRATAHSPTLDCLVPKGEYFFGGGGGLASSTTGNVAIALMAGGVQIVKHPLVDTHLWESKEKSFEYTIKRTLMNSVVPLRDNPGQGKDSVLHCDMTHYSPAKIYVNIFSSKQTEALD
uniref:Uncharacterized protein n=1 Tax=Lutzomyia longipalpis TaxID=7200 RepID=A0A1B0CGY5_LUTLO